MYDLSSRAKLYLMTMPGRPQWMPTAYFPGVVLQQLLDAGCIEFLEGELREFVRVTPKGETVIEKLVEESFGA